VYSSSQGRNLYLKTAAEGSSHYFRYSTSSGQTVWLYKVIEGGAPSDIPICSAEVTSVDAPVAGSAPGCRRADRFASYTASAVSWDPADDPFGENTAYTASVT
jgi:hypothetical protein